MCQEQVEPKLCDLITKYTKYVSESITYFPFLSILVVLLYPDISNFTFLNVKILKCKISLINFLDELDNFKQKNFYTSKCKIFLHFKATDPMSISPNDL